MSEQRGDPAAEAIAHDADAPQAHASALDAHPPDAGRPAAAHAEAGRPRDHAPTDDAAHHTAAVDDHDDHDHVGEALGPIDVGAWGAGILGAALGLVIALCFALATAGVG
jgi:hypothetical protein